MPVGNLWVSGWLDKHHPRAGKTSLFLIIYGAMQVKPYQRSHKVQVANAILSAKSGFLKDVLEGLSQQQKSIPAKYFYDERGSQLFDEICELSAYYPTRTEMGILQDNLTEIVQVIGEEVMLVEYGSGSSLKTRILLEHLEQLAGYVPIDISEEHLYQSARGLRKDFPSIEIKPVHADYSSCIVLPELSTPPQKRVVFFPGSTIGNFTPSEAMGFLNRIAGICGDGGGLLIGVDLQKRVEVLEAAYNDEQGVTAAFNLNLLTRINRELAGDFDSTQFEHKAVYNQHDGRIEMHLISKIDQRVVIKGQAFGFVAGESIHTENSYKYTVPGFAALAAHAGFRVQKYGQMSGNTSVCSTWFVVK